MDTTKTFAYGVANTIKEYLPPEYEDYSITVEEKIKNNNVVQVGICVHAPGENISPIIYMESFFDDIKSGEKIDHVMENIADCIRGCRSKQAVSKDFTVENYDKVKENIKPMLINTKANRQQLMQMPHIKVEDLSIICRLEVPTTDKDTIAHTKVSYPMMNMWDVSTSQLFEQAFKNASEKDAPVLTEMSEIIDAYKRDSTELNNMLEVEGPVDMGLFTDIYVLANDSRNYGASAIVCPGVAEKISELFPQGYYILPSSLHETLIVPKGLLTLEPKELGAMVREINGAVVEKEEVLSDRVYEFDKELGKIKQVPESIQKSRGVER